MRVLIDLCDISDQSELLEDGHHRPPVHYSSPFYASGVQGAPTDQESNLDERRPLLNSERLRDLPPKDILARAFHGTFCFVFLVDFSV